MSSRSSVDVANWLVDVEAQSCGGEFVERASIYSTHFGLEVAQVDGSGKVAIRFETGEQRGSYLRTLRQRCLDRRVGLSLGPQYWVEHLGVMPEPLSLFLWRGRSRDGDRG